MPASEYTVFFRDSLRVKGNVRVWRLSHCGETPIIAAA